MDGFYFKDFIIGTNKKVEKTEYVRIISYSLMLA